MKKILKYISAALFAICFSGQLLAQDNRTLETKVADILVQFPAKDMSYSDKLISEIIGLGENGIMQFCDKIIPPGTGDDTKARYAIESLARYSGAHGREPERKLAEQCLLKAVESANDKEVKAFFIRDLAYCGSDYCTDIMGKYLADSKLYSPAVAVLTTIGSEKAGAVLLNNLPNLKGEAQSSCAKALGVLKYKAAESILAELANTSSGELKRQSLYALANIALPSSEKTIVAAATNASFAADESEAMVAYIRYAGQLAFNGYKELSNKLCLEILKKCKNPNQLHFRSAALKTLREAQGSGATALLIKEFKNKDKAYRKAILDYAANGMTAGEVRQWIETAKKSSPDAKAQIIAFLAKREDQQVTEDLILPALTDKSAEVRIEGIEALSLNMKAKAVPVLLERLAVSTDENEMQALKKALLVTCGANECSQLAAKANSLNDNARATILEVLGERRATAYFSLVADNCQSANKAVSAAAYSALPNVSKPDDMSRLLGLLAKTGDDNIASVQKAIVALLEKNTEGSSELVIEAFDKGQKARLLPVFPYLNNPKAIKIVSGLIENGSSEESAAALEALVNWKNTEAIPILFKQAANGATHSKAFDACLKQIMGSPSPDDQKLLQIRKLMTLAAGDDEKKMVLKAAGSIKTFLSLVFISGYIDNSELSADAANSAMKVFLPTPGKNDGLTGNFVKETARKVIAKLTGPDSQYAKIDIQEYLNKMPDDKGFEPIFNGKNLEGWQGLVENPIARSKMTAKELAEKQAIADAKMLENWSAKDGCIVFNGKGANLCTKKKYGDFEMIVDWRITKEGDSGIYLRGSPQVQIWDTSRVDVGAQVGSGGLYNNQKNPSKPLALADNAIGDWNTFRIKMIGDKVTVYLNGILVVDNVTLENYWDRSLPIFPEEAIELQAHGTDLAFRDIYVREISGGSQLSAEEKAEGFVSLFNGKDLDYWVGNKTDYRAEDGMIVIRPTQGGHGNLYTAQEFSDFIFRFEFQLTPGANNGLGIHAPLEGDAAYVGKELQILDDSAPVYANLKPYQYHGSVYGIIPAKRGSQKPVGEWNYEEVIVRGDDIKITVNGQVIVDGNVAEAAKNGTPDHKDHPGLHRHSGHIGFLGHGSDLNFRNIRIKDLSK